MNVSRKTRLVWNMAALKRAGNAVAALVTVGSMFVVMWLAVTLALDVFTPSRNDVMSDHVMPAAVGYMWVLLASIAAIAGVLTWALWPTWKRR